MIETVRPAIGGSFDSDWTVDRLSRLPQTERDRLRQVGHEMKEMAAFGVTEDRRSYARDILRNTGLDGDLLDAFGPDREAWLTQAEVLEELLDQADALAVLGQAEPAAVEQWVGRSSDDVALGRDAARRLTETLEWASTPDRWERGIDHLLEEGLLTPSIAEAARSGFDLRGAMQMQSAETESLLGAIGTLNESGMLESWVDRVRQTKAADESPEYLEWTRSSSAAASSPSLNSVGSSDAASAKSREPILATGSTSGSSDPGKQAMPAETGSHSSLNVAGKLLDELDRIFLPAEALSQENIDSFARRTGFGLDMQGDDVLVRGPDGRQLFKLSRDDAAYLIHVWTPDFANRVEALGVVERDDLSPVEKRERIARLLSPKSEDLATDYYDLMLGPDGAGRDSDLKTILAKERLAAFDARYAASGRGTSGQDARELFDEFRAEVLPEVFGKRRAVAELSKDLLPFLGNLRSIRHLQNDIAEVERAIETGEWSDVAIASLLLVADAAGIFPGVNVLKTLGKGAVKLVPHVDGLLAERGIGQLDDLAQRARQVQNRTKEKVDPKRFFGDQFSKLPRSLQNSLRGLVNNRVGTAGDRLLEALGRRMDPKAAPQNPFNDLPIGNTGKSGKRIYDLSARKRSDLIREQFDPLLRSTLGRFERWADRFGGEPFRAKEIEYELKLNEAELSKRQRLIDNLLKNNEELARKKKIGEIKYVRMYESEIPIEFIIDDVAIYVNRWVGQRRLSRDRAANLLGALKEARRRGTSSIAMGDYVGLLARIAAEATRELEPTDDLSMSDLRLAPQPGEPPILSARRSQSRSQ